MLRQTPLRMTNSRGDAAFLNEGKTLDTLAMTDHDLRFWKNAWNRCNPPGEALKRIEL
jgi:hypothetical protein